MLTRLVLLMLSCAPAYAAAVDAREEVLIDLDPGGLRGGRVGPVDGA